MRKLATIQEISKLQPIENADNLEIASVLGWSCVVRKGEFKEGDLCVYFEIDSLLPITKDFEFLAKQGTKKCIVDGKEVEGYRLRTIKLRGQISQGLCLPLSILGDYNGTASSQDKTMTIQDLVGENVSEYLGVVKYEPIILAKLAGEVKGTFPSFIVKTDETRVQTLQFVLDEYAGKEFVVTEKLDGSSVTVYLKDGEFGVCSRNLELKETARNTIWKLIRQSNIEEKLRQRGVNIALQGEIVGEGINGNNLKLTGHKICWFNLFNIDKYEYQSFNDLIEICEAFNLETVPLITENFPLPNSIQTLELMANMKSRLNKDVLAEGLVFNRHEKVTNLQLQSLLGYPKLSFKVINKEYLLKAKE